MKRGDDITVLCQLEVHSLAQQLSLQDATRIARLARILAHLRDHSGQTLPQKLGAKVGADGAPVMSRLRFERLVQSEGEDLENALRRALPMVGNSCNIAHLGEALLFWTDKTRTRWCFDYYGAPAPEAVADNLTEENSQ